ncbi:MAG TPA: hypothetical protein VKU82_07405 [Planctomycetaceae bacterium]|nr:hypothetical protein [Planctomycetaceae bacterium]
MKIAAMCWCFSIVVSIAWAFPAYAAIVPAQKTAPTARVERPAAGAEQSLERAKAAEGSKDGEDKSDEESPSEPAASDDEDMTSDEIDRLEQAIELMRTASEKIAGEDTSPGTQKLQERAVKNLEELLELLKKQQGGRNRQSSQTDQQDQDQSQKQRQKLKPGQGDPRNSGKNQGPGSANDQNARRNSEKSNDSQERADPARSAAAEQARRQSMIKDVWGHLPPHVREAMQNAFSEKYLPKYEELVKKYYEALAEKNKKRESP